MGVVNPVQTMVSGVGKREGEVARGRGPESVLLEALELIESVAVDLPRPPGVGGVHVFCATMRGLRAKTNGSHQKSKPTSLAEEIPIFLVSFFRVRGGLHHLNPRRRVIFLNYSRE